MPNQADVSMEGESRRSATATTLLVVTQKLDTLVDCVNQLTSNVAQQTLNVSKMSIKNSNSNLENSLIRDLSARVPVLNILVSNSIVNFCIEVDDLITLNIVNQTTILKFLTSKMETDSRQLWASFIKEDLSWLVIRQRLLALLSSSELHQLIDKNIRRKQLSNEKFFTFASDIRKYARVLCPKFSPVEVIEIIFSHLNLTTFDMLKLHPQPTSYDELDKLCVKIEEIQSRVRDLTVNSEQTILSPSVNNTLSTTQSLGDNMPKVGNLLRSTADSSVLNANLAMCNPHGCTVTGVNPRISPNRSSDDNLNAHQAMCSVDGCTFTGHCCPNRVSNMVSTQNTNVNSVYGSGNGYSCNQGNSQCLNQTVNRCNANPNYNFNSRRTGNFQNNVSVGNQNPSSGRTVICSYCKSRGHHISDCRKRRYNTARYSNSGIRTQTSPIVNSNSETAINNNAIASSTPNSKN